MFEQRIHTAGPVQQGVSRGTRAAMPRDRWDRKDTRDGSDLEQSADSR